MSGGWGRGANGQGGAARGACGTARALTWRATWTGWRPSSESFHSSNVWNVAGTAQRYGRLSALSVATAFGWSCDAGPPTRAKPVRLITASTRGLPPR